MRNEFSKTLLNFAKFDSKILLLTGDHGYALFDEFRKISPKQYINAGVAEQNMVGVAAGLAKAGFRPFVYGLSAFIPIRVLEQIKLDICYENLPVVLIGDGAGVVYSTLGTSHQSTEDIAALRAIPNISIFSPADAQEMTQCMNFALNSLGPVYLRMGKADLGKVYDSPPNLILGNFSNIKQGKGAIAFVATGSMVKTALEISKFFNHSSVWSAPFIKPINPENAIFLLKQYKVIFTLEEHSTFGGLGSLLAELSTTYHPIRICRIGIKDRFSNLCGSYDYLIQEHRLNIYEVRKQVERFLTELHDHFE